MNPRLILSEIMMWWLKGDFSRPSRTLQLLAAALVAIGRGKTLKKIGHAALVTAQSYAKRSEKLLRILKTRFFT